MSALDEIGGSQEGRGVSQPLASLQTDWIALQPSRATRMWSELAEMLETTDAPRGARLPGRIARVNQKNFVHSGAELGDHH